MAKYQCRDTKTGEVRDVPEDMEDQYLLFEGNYSCDCNRAIMIFDVAWNDAECGHSRYLVTNKET